MIEKYIEILTNLNLKMGLNDGLAVGLAETTATLSLVLISIAIFFLVKFVLKKTIYKIIQQSTTQYDDLLIKTRSSDVSAYSFPHFSLAPCYPMSSPITLKPPTVY